MIASAKKKKKMGVKRPTLFQMSGIGFLAEEKTSNESSVLEFSSEEEQTPCSITNQWL